MSKIENGGLGQYGAEPFEQQQFGTAAGVEGVNTSFGHLLLYNFDDLLHFTSLLHM